MGAPLRLLHRDGGSVKVHPQPCRPPAARRLPPHHHEPGGTACRPRPGCASSPPLLNTTNPPAADAIVVLIGTVLTPGHAVRQNVTERQPLRQAGGAGCFEDARAEQRAALRALGRLEFVAQALSERGGLAASGIRAQISEVTV